MDELITDFLAETNEGLETLDNDLVDLEKNPNDQALLGSIFRVMHTIKGTCGFLGLPRLEAVAHAGENIMDVIRDGKMAATPEVISLILEALDQIKFIVGEIEQNEAEPPGDDQALIDKLNACASGESAPETAPEPEPAPAPAMAEEGEGGEEEEVAQDSDDLQALFDATPGPMDAPQEGGGEEEEVAQDSDDLQALFDATPGPMDTPKEKEDEVVTQDSDELQALFDATPSLVSDQAKDKAVNAGMAAKDTSKSVANQSIRVNLDILEGLMQMVSELVLTRNQLLQVLRSKSDSEFYTPLQHLSHITSELQERVMKTRMQPISNAWGPLPRIIRDLSHELGKKIELHQIGKETELDRQLLEFIKDPLTHMVRNSADHGLEGPEERLAAGKSETGTITLKAYHQGGHIIIEIIDDGRGLNVQKIKEKAIKNGLVTESEAITLTDQQIQQFIFKAGFSTAEAITSVSGRGVGMDVVKNNIEKISGTVELKSTEGKGSTFTIKIPLTLAIMSVLIVECQGKKFSIPQLNVLEMVRANSSSDLAIENINGKPLLRLRERLLPLISLAEVLSLGKGVEEKLESKEDTFIVVCEVGGYNFGVIVDRVYDTEEIVVKPVAPMLKKIEAYSGSTVLGDGSVIMILEPNGLAKSAGNVLRSESSATEQQKTISSEEQTSRFLVFQAGEGSQKVVPLELVARLEEIEVKDIEWSGGRRVLQYRDDLMQLVSMEDTYEPPESGIQQAIVFTDKDKVIGLMIDEITDIVEHHIDVTMPSDKDGLLGSMVIMNKTSELIDVGYFFAKAYAGIDIEEPHHHDHSKPRVLLIDDSPFFRKFIPPTLNQEGFAVKAVDSAIEALNLLENDNHFDIIITDIHMPDMDGRDFTAKCKESQHLRHIPIIALSSHDSDDLMKENMNTGLSGFVAKTNHTELVEKINQVLSSVTEGVS